MKKLGILVMAMVLVVGMSALVCGATAIGTLADDQEVSESVDVNVTVQGAARVDIESEGLTWNLEEPDWEGAFTDYAPVTVTANTQVEVSFEEDVSRAIGEALDTRHDDLSYTQAHRLVWRWDEEVIQYNTADQTLPWAGGSWVVSPGLMIIDPESPEGYPILEVADRYFHDDGFGKSGIFGVGEHNYDVGIGGQWRSQTLSGELLEWWRLTDDINPQGSITVTVAAAN